MKEDYGKKVSHRPGLTTEEMMNRLESTIRSMVESGYDDPKISCRTNEGGLTVSQTRARNGRKKITTTLTRTTYL